MYSAEARGKLEAFHYDYDRNFTIRVFALFCGGGWKLDGLRKLFVTGIILLL